MLEHKDKIKEHTKQGQTELSDIESPRECIGSRIEFIYDQLQKREGTPCEVHHDVEDRPTYS